MPLFWQKVDSRLGGEENKKREESCRGREIERARGGGGLAGELAWWW